MRMGTNEVLASRELDAEGAQTSGRSGPLGGQIDLA